MRTRTSYVVDNDRTRNSVQPLVVQNLREGNIIQHRLTGQTYVVTANYGKYAIAVRTMHVSNPAEWKLVKT